MLHQRFALISLSLLVALPGCGRLKVVDVPEPDDEIREAPAPRARPVEESTGTAWASQLALDACRNDVARRWRVSESSVRTSTRAHDASDGSDLVNWEAAGATGFCRVDRRAVVRETGARPEDVGLSAGTPDESGTVLVDWSLGTGRQGTCLVDVGNTVVQFRR